jgi:hypothetical protein
MMLPVERYERQYQSISLYLVIHNWNTVFWPRQRNLSEYPRPLDPTFSCLMWMEPFRLTSLELELWTSMYEIYYDAPVVYTRRTRRTSHGGEYEMGSWKRIKCHAFYASVSDGSGRVLNQQLTKFSNENAMWGDADQNAKSVTPLVVILRRRAIR